MKSKKIENIIPAKAGIQKVKALSKN